MIDPIAFKQMLSQFFQDFFYNVFKEYNDPLLAWIVVYCISSQMYCLSILFEFFCPQLPQKIK
jgi:hypothetical protein